MLNRQSSIDSIPQCLENGNEKVHVTSPQEIADTCNVFFTNIGEALAKSMPPANMSFFLIFLNTLFGSLNHFGQNVLHLVPKQSREKKKKKKTIKVR